MRSNNIANGKLADNRILNHLNRYSGILGVKPIGDYQVERWARKLTPTEQMENSINMYLGIDYLVMIQAKGYNLGFIDSSLEGVEGRLISIDTKGFNYSYSNYGRLKANGEVELMLLQVEKLVGKHKYNGWANDPNHKVEYLLILVNDHLYYMDYKKLVSYCSRFNRNNCKWKTFNKTNGYEICIQATVDDLKANGVIFNIERLVN